MTLLVKEVEGVDRRERGKRRGEGGWEGGWGERGERRGRGRNAFKAERDRAPGKSAMRMQMRVYAWECRDPDSVCASACVSACVRTKAEKSE